MKKLISFLTVCLIVNLSFAQKPFITKAGPGKASYQYMYYRGMAEGQITEDNGWDKVFPAAYDTPMPIASDSTTLINGTGLNILQVGQFFDLSYLYFINPSIVPINAPDLNATIAAGGTYKIDSVNLALAYFRVNPDEEAKDTLMVIISELDSVRKVIPVSTPGLHLFTYPVVGFDVTTGLPKNAKVFTYPLTVTDTTPYNIISTSEGNAIEFYFQNFSIPINQTMSNTKFQVSYTFKRAEVSTKEFNEVNHVLHQLFKDPFGYTLDFGNLSATSDEFKGDNLNFGLFVTKDTYYDMVEAGSIDYRQCTPSIIWNSPNPKCNYPLITVFASCNNCEFVGVQEQDAKNISVYPNPAQNTVNVQLTNATPAKIELINLVGQTVISQNASTEEVRLDVSNLNKGIYMIRVAQEGKVYTSKLVVR